MARHSRPEFLFLRYEDLLAKTLGELAKIARFLSIDAKAERLSQAVERSSADQMRKSEKAESHRSGLTKGSRPDLSFVRAAKSGGWKSSLPAPSVEQIESAWGPLMRSLGYELSSHSVPRETDYESLLRSAPR
jgi:hypothetical protein